MNETDRIIRERFQVKDGDTLPYTGLLKSTRNDLAKLFAELKFKSGAEIGVCSGEFSEVMLRANPECRLLLVDPWIAYESPWGYQVTQARADDRLRRAQERLRPYPNVEFIRKTSMEAVKDVPEGTLDYVFIDGLHDFDSAMMDLICWSKKVRPGGIVSGHDYVKMFGCQVPEAVNAYTRAHQINDWYATRERDAAWFWVQR